MVMLLCTRKGSILEGGNFVRTICVLAQRQPRFRKAKTYHGRMDGWVSGAVSPGDLIP
jgi:hypothetical protein